VVRILHTADVHLDAPFKSLGPQRGTAQRNQVHETFKRVVQKVNDEGFDLLLIAGDLFDSNRPSQRSVDLVAEELSRLHVPACILPGSHDPYDESSIYRRADFVRLPHVHLLVDPDRPFIRFDNLDLAVYGQPCQGRAFPPLKGLRPVSDSRWHVAMVHGSVLRGDIEQDEYPVGPDEIASGGMNYIALGHWHSFGDYSQGLVRACYSGSPEMIDMDQAEAGYIAIVELDDTGVQVGRERIGTRRLAKLFVNLEGKTSNPELKKTILEGQTPDPDLVLVVTLTGLSEIESTLDIHRLREELMDHFFFVKIINKSHPRLPDISTQDYPPHTVLGEFVRLMGERMSAVGDDRERRMTEQALQLGVNLLQGKEVLR
jgi:exonuclease SbcD